jgi:hypothetical protein
MTPQDEINELRQRLQECLNRRVDDTNKIHRLEEDNKRLINLLSPRR